MFEFLFPASMVAGVGLISSPIIIHLINRMRFKRIRWAAMEFLLKSQKRNRRRLIIEQLILLLLRILLVLLAAFIVARFIGLFFGGVQPQTSQHILLLDDTPSMQDQWLEQGDLKNSFKEAKRLVVDEIAKNAAKAGKAQHLKLLTVTQPEVVRFDKRLNDDTIKELGNVLGTIDCTALHVDLINGVQRARKIFEGTPQDQRVLYIVSDFRQTDWTGTAGDKLITELQELQKVGAHIKFVDVADPPRKEGEKDPNFHYNLALTQLRPEARVTARNRLTEFTVTVANYGLTEQKNVHVKVKVNGQERAESDVPIPVIRPGEKADAKFHVFLDQPGISQVSANLDLENTGLNIDNVRYAVVEVREKVPILLIDGDPSNSRKEGGDAYFLQLMFNANRGVAAGYDLILGAIGDLERPNLEQYPSIYLVNVRELNDKATDALKKYVAEGGNIAFFMGDRVNPEFYNRKLYDNGNGIFPVPLADRGPSPELTKEEKDERQQQNLNDPQYQLFVRNAVHPVFAAVWDEKVRGIFNFVSIDRYYPVSRARWRPTPGKTEELVTLPNRSSVEDYKDSVQELLGRLPLDNERYSKYRSRLVTHRDTIRDVLTGKPLYRLADAIEKMLNDQGKENVAEMPNLREFWGQPDRDIEELATCFEHLRQSVQYGDPLVVTGQHGKGRSVVWLTSIGRKWNNWAGDFPVSFTFPVIMFELQKWLTAGTSDSDLLVGTPLTVQLDAKRYEERMRRIYRPESKDQAAPAPKPDDKSAPGVQAGDVVMGDQPASGKADGRLTFRFADANKPGVYILEFTQRDESGEKREPRGYAFNIDTAAESNLMRIDKNALTDKVANSRFYTLGSDQFTDLEQRQPDLSETPWLYLAFLMLLVFEQALAVHLSYHIPGGAAVPGPAREPVPV